MSRRARLSRMEAEAQATIDRVMGLTAERLRTEFTIPERRAFCSMERRVRELLSDGVPCPLPLLTEHVEVVAGTVRLRGTAAVVATTEEWEIYYRITRRAVEVWHELGGPNTGWEDL